MLKAAPDVQPNLHRARPDRLARKPRGESNRDPEEQAQEVQSEQEVVIDLEAQAEPGSQEE